ncbi:Bug family tripartite tricarboxylate transporter substrate binding protein [Maritimibacter dapengensis]|uniref:Tripartite tricarboxylate transporter substrate binding protein n=1 Tax=Maritimibacter dapengensis TaxID=2836868 RepID=A0ABS6SYI4_9RHOB|nr:tripartite tricarboxylate transporter substrate binding protein [Maritimibacter dapengensis]MBV7377598.1 tripartite tricarboxylate transporter substrate binding protein [Maritimibacter dapengensis]
MLKGKTILSTVLATMLALPGYAQDDDYPSRPIEVIVPFQTGGEADLFSRRIVQAVNDNNLLPQPMVVVNKPGAGTTLASRDVKNADPDGYKVLYLHQTLITSNIMGTSDYGPEAFDPIAETHHVCVAYATGGDSGIGDIETLVKMSQDEPGSIKDATLLGSLSHFSTAMLNSASGADIRFVNVGGGGERISSVMGGHTQSMIITPYNVSRDDLGLNGLLYFGPERHHLMPDVPTAKEMGWDIESCVNYWWMTTKGTPSDRVQLLSDTLREAMSLPEVVEYIETKGLNVEFLEGDAFRASIDANVERLNSVASMVQ